MIITYKIRQEGGKEHKYICLRLRQELTRDLGLLSALLNLGLADKTLDDLTIGAVRQLEEVGNHG